MKSIQRSRLAAIALLASSTLSAGCTGIMAAEDGLTLEVAEAQVTCLTMVPTACLLVRESGGREFVAFSTPISGFVHESGYRYRLRVSRHHVANPPADGSSVEYRLVRVESKQRSPRYAEIATLLQNEARWRETRPARYTAEVERLCFCPPEARGPVAVHAETMVPGGREFVTGRHYIGSAAAVRGELAHLFPGVEGLFGEAIRAIAMDAHRVEIRYHGTMGYPTSVHIDMHENIADDEVEYRVLRLASR
jgi:hypothetical protein